MIQYLNFPIDINWAMIKALEYATVCRASVPVVLRRYAIHRDTKRRGKGLPQPLLALVAITTCGW